MIDPNRPSIRSTLPTKPGSQRPCLGCGEPTEVMAVTPFRPDLGAIPLGVLCQMRLLKAYDLWMAGLRLTASQELMVHRVRMLGYTDPLG